MIFIYTSVVARGRESEGEREKSAARAAFDVTAADSGISNGIPKDDEISVS